MPLFPSKPRDQPGGTALFAVCIQMLLCAGCCLRGESCATQSMPSAYDHQIRTDHRNFYSTQSLSIAATVFAAGAVVANTDADQEIRDWYQDDVRCDGTDDVASVVTKFGDGYLMLPALGIALAAGEIMDEQPHASAVGNWAERRGLTYTTGEVITHRAPLYPAFLAAAFEAGGVSLDSATWVPRIATALNAIFVALLARRLAGPLAGVVAGVAAASSSYLNGLGASLFLDQVQVTFILVSLLALATAGRRPDSRLYAVAGVAMGLAILVKESAIQLAPLPLAVFLLSGAPPGWRACLVAWTAGLVATAGWWWAWVYAHDGTFYLLGDAGASTARSGSVRGRGVSLSTPGAGAQGSVPLRRGRRAGGFSGAERSR